MIAPAFISLFHKDVTPGKLRSAFKKIGFAGMVEVALFADILTLKEALEFDQKIVKEEDYQLTSCCCPMWHGATVKIHDSHARRPVYGPRS
jgi:iron only hydrogenase large subunit-like protein